MIIDTDVLIWYLRGNPRARDLLASLGHAERQVSVLAHMELCAGARGAGELREIDRMIEALFSRVLPIVEPVSALALRLMRRWAPTHGLRPIDAMVAATALGSKQALATGNARHFQMIPGLRIHRFSP